MKVKPTHPRAPAGAVSGIRLLEKAFQILDLFTMESPVWTQGELVRQTGMPKSTLSRLVRYLCGRGYLTFAESRGRYGLGPAALNLGRRALALFDLRGVGLPILEHLARTTGETVMLNSFDRSALRAVCIEQIPSRLGGLRVFEEIGAAVALNGGASGKAILAYLPDKMKTQVLATALPALTEKTITDPRRLKRDIAETLRRGYSVSREETYRGVEGVGAPILDAAQNVIGSLAIAAPIHRTAERELEHYGALVRDSAIDLTRSLGGHYPWGHGANRVVGEMRSPEAVDAP